MLSKLLKYEIKATGRIFLPLFLSLLVFSVINKIISAFDPLKFNTPAKISMAIYIIIMAGMFVMTLTMMIQRFYKNLLSDEGYLMYTLPVKPWMQIVSKLLVSMLWVIASVIVAMISILIVAYKKGVIAQFFNELADLHNRIIEQLGALAYLFTLETVLLILLSLASGILLVYASIAIGHLFNRHKMLASFGAFIGLNTLAQIYFMLAGYIIKIAHFYHFSLYSISSNELVQFQLMLFIGFIFIGLQWAAYFAATNFILSKRLNLE